MKKVVGYCLALSLLVLALFAPAWVLDLADRAEAAVGATESVPEPTTITNYEADFALAADGELVVEERLTVLFPIYEARHGIFRFWDRTDTSDDRVRRRVEDVEVTLDGDRVPFTMETREHGRFDVAKIGDPDVFVTAGEHVYVIRYRLPDAIEPGYDGLPSSFYWDLVPSGWQQDIEKSTLTVTLPAAAQNVQCGIGLDADPPACDDVEGQDTRTVVVTTGPLPDHTPVTLRVGLDLPQPPPGLRLPYTATYDVVLGQSVPVLGGVLGAAVLAGLLGWFAARRARERTPPYPLLYAPPEGIGPAQAAYVMTEATDRRLYVASLMQASEHGALDLVRAGQSWTITDKSGAHGWAGLDPVTTSTAHLLGGPGTSFTADPKSVSAGERLKTEIATFDSFVKEWGKASGNLEVIRGASLLGLVVLLGLVAAGAAAIWNPFDMTITGLVPGAFAIMGISLLKTGATTRRTASGRQLWSQVGGFERILSTPSALDRFEFSGREELYTRYLPWAVAFGCADEWAEKFRTEMGHEPPTPHYFGAYAGGYAGASIGSMVDDFDSAVGSAISSYDATQSSSSSGGGFSGGGGGGGGGGGSW